MNIYLMIGNNVGTQDAVGLGERLGAWHDAMVAHERRSPGSPVCDEECPHSEAAVPWKQAVTTFGPYAADLSFLRLRDRAAAADPIEAIRNGAQLAHSSSG